MSGERKRRPASGQSNGAGPTIAPEPLAFEEALGKLDDAVSALESGQLPLEEAMQLYEEGVRLAQRCQELLDSAELRLQRLRAATGSNGRHGDAFELEPFALDDQE